MVQNINLQLTLVSSNDWEFLLHGDSIRSPHFPWKVNYELSRKHLITIISKHPAWQSLDLWYNMTQNSSLPL